MMVGQEFVLHPSSGIQVAFQGRVIAQVSSSTDDAKLQGRSHSITIYESARGDIIASIEFKSTASHELDFCWVEPTLSMSEIPDFLACQDPTEHIDRAHWREHNAGDVERFLKVVYHDYDALSIDVERQLESFVPCKPDAPTAT